MTLYFWIKFTDEEDILIGFDSGKYVLGINELSFNYSLNIRQFNITSRFAENLFSIIAKILNGFR